jgi:hypothetical protein
MKDDKLSLVSGGGIPEYEAMVKEMLQSGYTKEVILTALYDEKKLFRTKSILEEV